MHGATLNAKECVNMLIWQRCPEETFCDGLTVETITYPAVAEYSDGAGTVSKVLQRLGDTVGHTLERARGVNTFD